MIYLPMQAGADLLQIPIASPSPLSTHVVLDKVKSDRPYPVSQEYVQMLLNLSLFEQAIFPLVGSVGTRLHDNAENKIYSW